MELNQVSNTTYLLVLAPSKAQGMIMSVSVSSLSRALISLVIIYKISGWDYSSRWMEDNLQSNDDELLSVKTGDILPVDLNSFLCRYLN